jgi:hypothetical protein
MFDFDGSAKSKRNINLGRKHTAASSQETIRKAQIERENREKEREKLRAIEYIQVDFNFQSLVY